MLLGIWWDHEHNVSVLLLLIHPAQATTSPLFGEADVQFLEEKWPFPRYAFHYEPQGSQSIRFWCCLIFARIMKTMYQYCCCSFILHKPPLHPFLARLAYNFLEEKWPCPWYPFSWAPRKPKYYVLMLLGIWCDHENNVYVLQYCSCSSILHKPPLHPFLARPTYNFWKRNGHFCFTPFSTNPKGSQVLGFDAAWYLMGSWKRCISTVVAHPSCTSHHFTPFCQGQCTIFGREMAVSVVRFSVQTPRKPKY